MTANNPLGDPVVSGSAVVALSGLAILPLEPFTGLTLLAAGLGVGGVKVKGDAEKQQAVGRVEADLVKAKEDLKKAQESQMVEKNKAAELESTKDTLTQQNTTLKWVIIGSAVAAGCYVTYRVVQHLRKLRMTIGRSVVSVDHPPPVNYSPKQAHDTDTHCIICYENIPDLVLKPCRHTQLCWICLNKLTEPSCPTCRCTFNSVDFVYS
eukprot:TRINITY_DN1038_c0_g1_i11.p1 TRINITY_DN1038_c0_g1~~TRINITY_DN1038_c0_g1_i11.p1  ORF type:complete len:230 (+),score=41.75 TRINITY_DN1038_c0_g1_i11:64-690(+)